MSKKSFKRKGTKRNRGRTRKQKMYNMKGCSKCRYKICKHNKLTGGQGCGSSGCPSAPYSWNQMNMKGGECNACMKGGECSSCMKGGNFYKPAAPVPPPLVGDPWTPSIKGWPGVDGIDNNRNYLSNNLYNEGDPQTMMKLGGSKKKGGGLMPQNLTNLGRGIEFNFKSLSNSLYGYSAPTNPLPYKDQFPNSSISLNKLII
jgi:hypothetical protein